MQNLDVPNANPCMNFDVKSGLRQWSGGSLDAVSAAELWRW